MEVERGAASNSPAFLRGPAFRETPRGQARALEGNTMKRNGGVP